MHGTGYNSKVGGRRTNMCVYRDRWKREGSNRTKKEGWTGTVAILKNTVGGGVTGKTLATCGRTDVEKLRRGHHSDSVLCSEHEESIISRAFLHVSSSRAAPSFSAMSTARIASNSASSSLSCRCQEEACMTAA